MLPGFNDLATTRPDLAAQWHPTKNTTAVHETLAGSKSPTWWTGPCGHAWERPPAAVRNQAVNTCPTCTGRTVLDGFNDLATIDPTLSQDWHPTQNPTLTPHDVTVGSSARVWWQGPCGHEWQATVASRATGRTNGCPVCANKLVITGINDLATTNPDLAAQWHPTRNGDLDPSTIPAGSARVVWWRCPTNPDHEWKARLHARLTGQGCPRCATQGTSKIEAHLRAALAAAGETVSSEATLPVRWGARNRPAHCDVILTDRHTVIEYDGSYWHATKTDADTLKTTAILDAGWRLIRIRETPLPHLTLTHPNLTQLTYDFNHGHPDDLAHTLLKHLHTSAT